MKYVAYLIMIWLIASCSQGVRVENSAVDEVQLLTYVGDPINELQYLGHKSADEYPTALSSGGLPTSTITKLIREEDDVFAIFPEEMKIISLSENDLSIVDEYDISEYGKPIDLFFPNTSNGYFTVEGKDTIFILDRISKQIASINVPAGNQPTVMTSRINKLYVANSGENTVSVISTNLKQEDFRIPVPAQPKFLGFQEDSNVLIIICQNTGEIPVAIFYDTDINATLREVFFTSDNTPDEVPDIKSFFISSEVFDFAWIGAEGGVYRLDLRNQGNFIFIEIFGEDVIDIEFDPVEENIIYLGRRDELSLITAVDPVQFGGNFTRTIFPDNTKFIFPIRLN